MCGIVGAIAERDVSKILIEGLKRLEYRGYDSAGLAVITPDHELKRQRTVGKVANLEAAFAAHPLQGFIGIAHTRWATHGKPTENNAHPHQSGSALAVVHNGIIENHLHLRHELSEQGYLFETETDTEVVAHLLHALMAQGLDLRAAVKASSTRLQGSFAIVAIHKDEPEHLIALCQGNPIVIGIGVGEHFLASDSLALLPVTQRFVYLEEGDIVVLARTAYQIYDQSDKAVKRPVTTLTGATDSANRGQYRHFMQKEIAEQVYAIASTLEGRLNGAQVIDTLFGQESATPFAQIQHVQLVACGTSYHAALVARYWLEAHAGLSCQVEVASEYRYRQKVIPPNSLFVAISQSGETADTLAALRQAKTLGYVTTLAICNVANSSLVREADLQFMTRAGIEIGVASTKAFTTQLTALLLLTLALGRKHALNQKKEAEICEHLRLLPEYIRLTLLLDQEIQAFSLHFADKNHTLFIGRGELYPVALEGALKLKEISYIHAEAYPGGELKHGPLALVDKHMPVIAMAPDNAFLDKIKSNISEVMARGGQLVIFTDTSAGFKNEQGVKVITLPVLPEILQPIVYTIPLQLLAYHVALIKGTDVDQPRNLAKSVTVE